MIEGTRRAEKFRNAINACRGSLAFMKSCAASGGQTKGRIQILSKGESEGSGKKRRNLALVDRDKTRNFVFEARGQSSRRAKS